MFDTDAPLGAIATRFCVNPDCLAEPGERHDPDCTPDPHQKRTTTAWSGEEDWS